ncbi:MAG: 3-oxoacyl-ACP reductase [Frankiales bacterium]|jgi:3-oxoacyl-[acyl-carrier protein] reductase|nr:3-oxoacyl-ACP reductase [Frankiales bacterium]MCW2707736.1 3-oxoacyl-ACP reductase [Frankiales bacterium]
MTGLLTGRVALVTGAASGIGAAIAEAYAREGATLCLVDISTGTGLADVAKRCEDWGVRTITLLADVSKEDDVTRAFADAEAELGAVDILVNNAGILTECRVSDMSAAMFDELIAVDLRSVFLCSRAAIPGMQRKQFGRIINVSSQLGQKGGVGLAHYSAAKAGVIGFTRALARELARDGITVNSIAPGPIHTALSSDLSDEWIRTLTESLPLGRFGYPDEVAPTAVLLASEPGGNLYTGQTLGPNSGDVMP